MKRVGELYEVVVFTASVSKVGLLPENVSMYLYSNTPSMATLYLINWISMALFITGSSVRVVTIIRVTMSRSVSSTSYHGMTTDSLHRTFPKLAATSKTPSSLTIHQPHISSTLNMPCQSAAGSPTPTTTNCLTLYRFSKTWLAQRSMMSALFLTSVCSTISLGNERQDSQNPESSYTPPHYSRVYSRTRHLRLGHFQLHSITCTTVFS